MIQKFPIKIWNVPASVPVKSTVYRIKTKIVRVLETIGVLFVNKIVFLFGQNEEKNECFASLFSFYVIANKYFYSDIGPG